MKLSKISYIQGSHRLLKTLENSWILKSFFKTLENSWILLYYSWKLLKNEQVVILIVFRIFCMQIARKVSRHPTCPIIPIMSYILACCPIILYFGSKMAICPIMSYISPPCPIIWDQSKCRYADNTCTHIMYWLWMCVKMLSPQALNSVLKSLKTFWNFPNFQICPKM